MPDVKPNVRKGKERAAPERPAAKRPRIASRLFRTFEFDSEAFRAGFERIEEAGLLDNVLKYLEGKDLFALAKTSHFFREEAIRHMSRKVTDILGDFFKDVKAFVAVINALDVRISGLVLMPLILDPTIEKLQPLVLHTLNPTILNALTRHLVTYEGYKMKLGSDTSTVFSRQMLSPQPTKEAELYMNMNLHGDTTKGRVSESTWIGGHRRREIIVKSFESSANNPHLSWLALCQHYTASVYQLSSTSFKVFYPDLTFNRITKLVYLPQNFQTQKQLTAENLQVGYEMQLLSDGGPDGIAAAPYFSYNNTHRPASIPLKLS